MSYWVRSECSASLCTPSVCKNPDLVANNLISVKHETRYYFSTIYCKHAPRNNIIVLVFIYQTNEWPVIKKEFYLVKTQLERWLLWDTRPLCFANQWIVQDIPSLGSQSECVENTIHWFGILYTNLRYPPGQCTGTDRCTHIYFRGFTRIYTAYRINIIITTHTDDKIMPITPVTICQKCGLWMYGVVFMNSTSGLGPNETFPSIW